MPLGSILHERVSWQLLQERGDKILREAEACRMVVRLGWFWINSGMGSCDVLGAPDKGSGQQRKTN